MKRAVIVLGIFVVCGALSTSAAAAEAGWRLRVFAAGLDPSLNETVLNGDGSAIAVTSGSDLGFGASLEYQFTELLGLELGGFRGSPEIELSTEIPGYGPLSVRDALSTQVYTLDLNFHLTPNSPSFDVYVGAGLAQLAYGDLHYTVAGESLLDVNISNDTTWSAKANVDIALGTSNWTAFGGLRYIWTDLKGTNAGDPADSAETYDFDTFSFSVGIGYRF